MGEIRLGNWWSRVSAVWFTCTAMKVNDNSVLRWWNEQTDRKHLGFKRHISNAKVTIKPNKYTSAKWVRCENLSPRYKIRIQCNNKSVVMKWMEFLGREISAWLARPSLLGLETSNRIKQNIRLEVELHIGVDKTSKPVEIMKPCGTKSCPGRSS